MIARIKLYIHSTNGIQMSKNEEHTKILSPDEVLESRILEMLKAENIINEDQTKEIKGKLSIGLLKSSDWESIFTEKVLEIKKESQI